MRIYAPAQAEDPPRTTETCLTPSHRKLFVPSAEQYAVTVLSAMGINGLNSAPLTCFLSSLRRFISAAFSSLVMPTRVGCVVFAIDCCGSGGVAVGDRLGTTCLRGVTVRRGIAVDGSNVHSGSSTRQLWNHSLSARTGKDACTGCSS